MHVWHLNSVITQTPFGALLTAELKRRICRVNHIASAQIAEIVKVANGLSASALQCLETASGIEGTPGGCFYSMALFFLLRWHIIYSSSEGI